MICHRKKERKAKKEGIIKGKKGKPKKEGLGLPAKSAGNTKFC